MSTTTLSPQYSERLNTIKETVQQSEELQTYLDSEEADDYVAFKDTYEPELAALYQEVAEAAPLELLSLEQALLDDAFEGLSLPKVLGYAVLRPLVSERGQYYRPQQHLKDVLLAIANSSAFAELEKRIGQGITVALALSTQVWVSNLLGEIPNKLPRNFFAEHKDESIRTPEARLRTYERYKRQFRSDNYATASFPEDASELVSGFRSLEAFLRYRFGVPGQDNSSLQEPIKALINNKSFEGTPEFERLYSLAALFMDLPADMENAMRTRLRKLAADPSFSERFFALLSELYHDDKVEITPEVDKRAALRVGTAGDTLMSQYYNLITVLHAEGVDSLETQDAIRLFTREQEGTSEANECVRQAVLRYIRDLLSSLDVERYAEFYEATKLFAVHFGIFRNEAFKQEIRTLSVGFVKQLMKRYTDKRGRDYQDIKKFVKTEFEDLGFMTERELTNFFKTKRKRSASKAE